MRKFNKILISAVLVSAMVISPVYADEGPQVDMSSLTFSAEDQAEIDAWQSEVSAAQSEVDSLTEQLSTLIIEIGELETQLIEKGEEISLAEADLEEAQAKSKAQYASMKLRIKFMYESGNGSLVSAMVSDSESVSDVMNKAEYANNISAYDRDMIQEYADTQAEIEALKDTLVTQQDELLVAQDEMNAKQEELNTLIDEKQNEVADFDAMLQDAIRTATANAVAAEQDRIRQDAAAAAMDAARNAESMDAVEQAYLDAGGAASEFNAADYTGAREQAVAAQAAAEAAAAQAVYQDNAQDGASEDSWDDSDSSDDNGGDSYEEPASTYCGYNAGTGNAIVDAAYTQLGVPYVWGGTTPYVALDCSGLVQYCYGCAGISIPRTSSEMIATGVRVSDPQPGDICWTPGHVAVYIGGGQMIEAQQSGVPVKVSSVRVSQYLRYY